MLKPTLVSTSKTYYTLLINNCIFLFGQILFLDYYDLLIFVGLDGYTPQKDRFCYQEDGETYGRMNATNLTSAEEECSANTNCLLFTDWCGRGDEFYWCIHYTGDKQCLCNTASPACPSVLYMKNH